MKISIDTKEDSHDDIRRVIKMLQHLVGEEPYSNQGNIFSDSNGSESSESGGEATNAFSAMFGDNSQSSFEEPKEAEEEKPSKKRFDDEVQILPY